MYIYIDRYILYIYDSSIPIEIVPIVMASVGGWAVIVPLPLRFYATRWQLITSVSDVNIC